MTLIRTDIQATVKHSPIEDIDIQEITVWFGNEKFIMYNVYCPPLSKVELSFKEVTFSKTIVAGDFNAHIPSLGYSDYNPRGHNIEDILNSSNLCLLQDSTSEPTLFHRRHGTTSRPDLTMISSDIVEKSSVEVLEDIGSDHRPNFITVTRQQHGNSNQKGNAYGTSEKQIGNFIRSSWTVNLRKYQQICL